MMEEIAENKMLKEPVYCSDFGTSFLEQVIFDAINQEYDFDLRFEIKDDWMKTFVKEMEAMDFAKYDLTDSNVYWHGILTATPFDSILSDYTEADILNLIKNQHLKIGYLYEKSKSLSIYFCNPKISPLYEFFNKIKVDGNEDTLTHTIDMLVAKLDYYMRRQVWLNLWQYGEYHLHDDDGERKII